METTDSAFDVQLSTTWWSQELVPSKGCCSEWMRRGNRTVCGRSVCPREWLKRKKRLNPDSERQLGGARCSD